MEHFFMWNSIRQIEGSWRTTSEKCTVKQQKVLPNIAHKISTFKGNMACMRKKPNVELVGISGWKIRITKQRAGKKYKGKKSERSKKRKIRKKQTDTTEKIRNKEGRIENPEQNF